MEANEIPSWVRTDWKLYKETLFHILQNAMKFNNDFGSVNIVLSYHSLELDSGSQPDLNKQSQLIDESQE